MTNEKYTGPLCIKKMPKELIKPYTIWCNQRARCNNPNVPQYKYYGGRGLSVSYTSREFLNWWTANIRGKNFRRPTCGRIDHDKGYSFDNIKIEELVDNVKEENLRLGHAGMKPRKVVLLDSKGNPAIIFESMTSAEKQLGISPAQIHRMLRGLRPTAGGFKFKDWTEA